MTCDKCGSPCQGKLCRFCEREEYRTESMEPALPDEEDDDTA
jgi:hypothetical protein